MGTKGHVTAKLLERSFETSDLKSSIYSKLELNKILSKMYWFVMYLH